MRPCTCGDGAIARYRSRLSGPLLDRLDLQVDVPAVPFADLSASRPGESSAAVRARVAEARKRQLARFGRHNGELPPGWLREHVRLEPAARRLLADAVDRLGLSGRAHDRVLRVSLTIADLAAGAARPAAPPVTLAREHVAEALAYRALDPDGRALTAGRAS